MTELTLAQPSALSPNGEIVNAVAAWSGLEPSRLITFLIHLTNGR